MNVAVCVRLATFMVQCLGEMCVIHRHRTRLPLWTIYKRAVCIVREINHLRTTFIANGRTLLFILSHWDTSQALEDRYLGLLDLEK
jgi:hypothetical protein